MSGIVGWAAAREFPHGTRSAYVRGCRCEPCTVANRVYARGRSRARRVNHDWNGLVSAEKARTHLLRLSRAGVGRRAVGAACDVADSILQGIRAGTRTRCRARVERLILDVDAGARSDASLVSAGRTWRLIRLLLEEGFSKAELARRMGFVSPAIQFRKGRVLARTALRVQKLYRAATT